MSTLSESSQGMSPEVEASEQVLYQSAGTLITRRWPLGYGGSVIVKQAVSAEAARRVCHETRILERLAHVDGVPRIAGIPPQAHALALQDDNGLPLSRLLKEKRLVTRPSSSPAADKFDGCPHRTGQPPALQRFPGRRVDARPARQCPLGLAMIDIDSFKLYNDHYGQQGGDACLQLVVQSMTTGRRGGSDLVARYGGEEFAVLLPCTDMHCSGLVAERIRAAVEALAAPHARSTNGIVTISVGVTSFVPTSSTKPTDLIAAANAALYEAKRAGRNREVLKEVRDPFNTIVA